MMVAPTDKIFPSENYFIVTRHNAVLQFDKQGNYIRHISKSGNGPEDFSNGVLTPQIDEFNNRLYLTDSNFKRMQIYRLNDGKYVGKIPFSYLCITPTYLVNSKDSSILITQVPMKGTPSILWKQDFYGNLIQEINVSGFPNPKGEWIIGWDAFYLWENDKQEKALYIVCNPAQKDTLYHYNETQNILHARFTMNFPNEIPDHWIYETSNYYIVTINGQSNVADTGYMNGPQKRIVVNKETLQGAYAEIVLDGYGNIPITNQRFDMWSNYFTLGLDSEWLKNMTEKALSQPERLEKNELKKLEKLAASITEDDNIFILYGKIK